MPRKKIRACSICGGMMYKGGAGYVCTNCHNVEWFTEETTTHSSVAKCPHCGQISPNLNFCVYCSEPISEWARKLKERKENE
jgi:predicted RNA-binding Zn-ribbon protein involved in translation (DUF1610 family)